MSQYDEDFERYFDELDENSGVDVYDGVIKKETDLAVLFLYNKKEFWLPKSKIRYPEDHSLKKANEEVPVEIPDWLAIEKGLI